jgi:hypothetical protein
MFETTAIPAAIQAALSDALLCDALSNVLDTLLRLRRQEASCWSLANDAGAYGRAQARESALAMAEGLACSRGALGDRLAITADHFQEPFAGTALDPEDVPDSDLAQALGDPDLCSALSTAANSLLALKARSRAGSLDEWLLRYIAEEPFDAPL